MKTSIAIPDNYHKRLRKIAIDRSSTMAELICEAIREKFFRKDSSVSDEKPSLPFNELRGILSSHATMKDIQDLKKLWNRKL